MAVTKHLVKDYATLTYDDVQGIIRHQFHQPVNSETFRKVLNAGLDLLKTNGATKWLSDDRKNDALKHADTNWAVNTWAAKAIENGWQHWALVVPEDDDARQVLVEHVSNYSERGVNVRVFTNPNEAFDWLIQQ